MRGPVFPTPIHPVVSQPVAPAAREAAVDSTSAAKKEFMTLLVAQLMKDGFFTSDDSAVWGDGPNKEYIRTLLTEKMSEIVFRSLPLDPTPPVVGEP